MPQDVGGVAFEREIATRLRNLGWMVETTPSTGDFGADLVAKIGAEVVVIQCKDYGSPAGVSAVQEVYLAKAHYRATAASVVARNGFTKAAKRAGESTSVGLFVPSDLTIGSQLDRTPILREQQRRQAEHEKNELKREKEKYHARMWRVYDKELATYSKKLKYYPIIKRICIFVIFVFSALISYINITNMRNREDLTFCLFLAVAVAFVIADRRPHLPKPPSDNRRGAKVSCDICGQKLRVEYGRDGQVRCPNCRTLISVRT